MEYCVSRILPHVVIKTDSLILKTILDGIWEVPWKIANDIQRIKGLMSQFQVEVVHKLREGNKMEDFFDNEFFVFAAYQNKEYTSLQDITTEGKQSLS